MTDWVKFRNTIDVPCQGCGKLVQVQCGFVGCVFCQDCMRRNEWGAGTDDFSIERVY